MSSGDITRLVMLVVLTIYVGVEFLILAITRDIGFTLASAVFYPVAILFLLWTVEKEIKKY